jgi:hypothetical protein
MPDEAFADINRTTLGGSRREYAPLQNRQSQDVFQPIQTLDELNRSICFECKYFI